MTKTKAKAKTAHTKTKAKPKATAKAKAKPTLKAKSANAASKKAPVKAKGKPQAKAKAAPKAKHGAHQAKGTNALWKLLKQKEERLKAAQADGRSPNAMYNEDSRFQSQPRHDRFARFAGPRRRAA